MQSPSPVSSVALSGIVARRFSADVGKGAIYSDMVGFGLVVFVFCCRKHYHGGRRLDRTGKALKRRSRGLY